MKARVTVTLRPSILDPQGKAIVQALSGLGFGEVADARAGKIIDLTLAPGTDPQTAQERIDAMCRKLLANPVIEDYAIEIIGR